MLFRTKTLTLLVAVAAFTVAACGGQTGNEPTAAIPTAQVTTSTLEAVETSTAAIDAATTIGGDLQDADDAIVDRARAEEGSGGELGVTYILEDGTGFAIDSIELDPGHDSSLPWQRSHLVMVRAENRTGQDVPSPSVSLLCDNDEFSAGPSYDNSTYAMTADMPPGTERTGLVVLGIPSDDEGFDLDCDELVLRVYPSGAPTNDEGAPALYYDVPPVD